MRAFGALRLCPVDRRWRYSNLFQEYVNCWLVKDDGRAVVSMVLRLGVGSVATVATSFSPDALNHVALRRVHPGAAAGYMLMPGASCQPFTIKWTECSDFGRQLGSRQSVEPLYQAGLLLRTFVTLGIEDRHSASGAGPGGRRGPGCAACQTCVTPRAGIGAIVPTSPTGGGCEMRAGVLTA